MTEENEKKAKPRISVVKKTAKDEGVETVKTQSPVDQDKKKVVVVKKKVVVHSVNTGSTPQGAPQKDSSVAQEKKPSGVVTPGSMPRQSVREGGYQPKPLPPKPEVEKPVAPPVERPAPAARPVVPGVPSDRPAYQGQGGDRPGYQGNSPRPGYQGQGGDRPGYQGNSPRPGYQGQSPSGDRPGYQGNSPRPGGYQGGAPRPGGYQGQGGGYQGGAPRPGGYQGGAPRPGGYQGGAGGGRPGGYQGGAGGGRPGGYQGGTGGGRPGGFNRPGAGGPPSSTEATGKKVEPKKFRTKKGSGYVARTRETEFEKALNLSKKNSLKANPVPTRIEIMEVISVAELARKMNLKASELIGKLMSMGMMVTINEQIDAETATIIAGEYGTEVKIVSLYDETIIDGGVDLEENMITRPPIVTIMGHVDHGKTKLLDAIRTTNVAGGEHGGITQHIGAYRVSTPKGDVTFLDTPGHEAFTLMRARGAQITDIVVLVVAANDGVMPQTLEAIDHAKEAGVPIIVAINKVDLPEANPEKVRQQLSDRGLMPEDWGGQTLYVEISALKKLGLDHLMDTILLQSEVLDLKAIADRKAEGRIIESKIDQGRGVVATVIIQKGTLKIGDCFVGGIFPGKVRAMFDDLGKSITVAGPSTPVEILGFNGIPSSGDPFQVVEDEKTAREYGEKRQELKRWETGKNVKKVTLENLYDSIQDGEMQELKVIIKADVHGSVEALAAALEKLSTNEIRLRVIRSGAGAIIENDVNLAAASNAIIVGFHVRPTAKAQLVADQEKVEIRKYNIIYDAVEDIRTAMEGMLAPELKEVVVGSVEIRETFKVPKIGLVAGCMVISGKIKRNCSVHLLREGIQMHTGKINTLRRFKDDAKEVVEGFECGVGLENFTDVQVGDTLEVFEIIKIAKKLGDGKK